ncbi:2aacee17-bfd8-494d-bf43-b21dcb936e6a [Thermothielavioides terrestris]|uniref:2aacee17-bfd8-494d-bf43-b21dcb936e6a n=1 Tax=Thermothielavioides terrestris TaxID=2587410 RepID=A0A446BRM3_9PEZI|nr:2aacee17-bfd8-494d-bf43-b21dcb936e6a [Thermothielavioides terrestris]
MTQLFEVARAACDPDPQTTTPPPLRLVVQLVRGKSFMKAFDVPEGPCLTKRDGTGRLVPTFRSFCTRMRQLGAQSFRDVASYESSLPPPCDCERHGKKVLAGPVAVFQEMDTDKTLLSPPYPP